MSLPAQRRKLAHAVVVSSLFLSAGIVRAQGNEPLSQPKTVPIELVTALVGSGGVSGPDEPRILVGSAPEWVMPRIVVPSGGRVLGAAFQGTTALTIINIPLAGDSVIPELRRSLLQLGWNAVPVAQRMISPGGFMPAAPVLSAAAAARVTLCDGKQVLNASLVRRDVKSADVAYRISTAAAVSPCNPPQMPNFGMRLPWPALTNPTGSIDARMTGECSATLTGSSGIGTTLRTAMSSDSVLAFYARQLADSGWKAESERALPIGKVFAREDSSGSPVELTLTVTTTPRNESCRDVYMQVRTLKKP